MMEFQGGFCFAAVLTWILVGSLGINAQVVSPGRRTEDSVPTIVEQPKSLIVTKGEPATFKCRADGRPEPVIQWLKDGQELVIRPGDPRRNLLDSGSTLFFLQVVGNRQGGQDGGVYQCVARNSLGTVYSNNATLEIAYLRDDFKEEPATEERTSGDTAVLVCTPPRGFPTPEVTWLKDDVVLVPDNNRVKVLEDGNLLLKELRKDDEGTYKCKAQNVAGEKISREAVLTVNVKPSFINPPQDTITAPGEAATLRCEVEGDPAPEVLWSREVGELPAGRYTQLTDNSLRIRHTEEDDDGIYICTATNLWGSSEARARLRVSAVPDFIRAPRDKTTHVNQDVRFQCEAVGSPPPSIHWQKAGTEDNLLFINQQRGRFEVTSSGELHISSVRMEDAGTYVCTATGGTAQAEASAVLRVIDETLAPPPVIQYGPANQTLAVGSTATFLCRSAGNPAPTIQWTKDGTAMVYSSPRFSRQSDGTLQITGVQSDDAGLYTCLATNNSGETSQSASLVIIDSQESLAAPEKIAPSTNELPNAPSQPLRVNVTRMSIHVRWTAPTPNRAPPVLAYQLEYFSPEQTTGWVVAATSVQGENFLITHLIPASSYMIIVRAINMNGVGPPSPMSETITTADDSASLPTSQECLTEYLTTTMVEITRIDPLSPTALKVTWRVLQNEDRVDGYQVRYRLSSGNSNAWVQPVSGMTSTIITGLDAGMEYTVSVRPKICDRAGEESSAEAARTLDEGKGLHCLAGDNRVLQNKLDGSDIRIVNTEALGPTAIQVRWEVARHAAAYIEGYHIKYWETDASPSEYSIETITGPALTFVMRSLVSWQQYTISVRPFSGFYCGAESAPVVARSGADVPRGPPQSVSARSNGSHAVLVSWRPPSRDLVHGYIKGYYISCRGNTTAQLRNLTVVGNTTLMGRVSGLEAGKRYQVQVAAFTTAGMGPSSSVVILTLPIVDPDPDPEPDPPNGGDDVTSKPWFYGIIAGIIMVVLLVLIAFVLRRRKLKHAANLTKNPLEGATHMTALTSQYDSQPPCNGHPSWPPDQTWRSNNSSECQSTSLHGNGSASVAVTTFAPHTHANGSLRSVLGKNQYLQPHHSGAASPAYWLLEAYESKEQMQMAQGEKSNTEPCENDNYNRNNVPVYAVVDNDSEDDDESPSCPHMSHTLPMNQCNHMHPEHCQSLPPHMTEPYASTTLVLPPNIREYMAQRQNCSDTSSGSASGSITYPLPATAGQQKGRKKSGKKSKDGGPPLPPQRDGSHLCVDCQSGLSDSGGSSQGSRRKPKTRTGAGSKYPSCNWTEFLPPPPEEPPMGSDQDPMGKSKSHPCNGHSMPHPMAYAPNGHQGFIPIQPAMMGHPHHHHGPALPMRQYPYYAPHPQSNGLPHPHTLPVVSRGDELHHQHQHQHQHQPPMHTLPAQRPTLISDKPYPVAGVSLGALQGGQGVAPNLAPHQVFEDPRHEQLGRELLQFNDDLMSQSEVMSDNEEGTPMLPRIAPSTATSDQSTKLIPDDLADLETSSNCTGSMMASWASMNGSSTGGSNRNSGSSCTSDGSFCAETDFAAAVTAAAQNAGIKVVESPPADSTKVGRDLEAGEQTMSNGSANQSKRSTPTSRKGPAHPTSLFPEQTVPQYHYNQQQQQQQQQQDPSQRILPPPPASQMGDAQHQDSVNKNKRRTPPTHDNLFLRDTNDLGLTVTANPMAFAHEEEEGFSS